MELDCSDYIDYTVLIITLNYNDNKSHVYILRQVKMEDKPCKYS